jgi:hypothetical protein
LAAWSAEELVSSSTTGTDGRVVAIGGLPIVTEPVDEVALLRPEVVARHAHSLRSLTERLDGPYAIAAISQDGSGTVVNDPFGLHPLYLGTAGPTSVVSNRAALVAAVLERMTGRRPEPDEGAVAWLLLNGQMFGDETPYRGVSRLPFGSCAMLGADGELRVRPWHEPPWRSEASSLAPHPSVDDAEQRMIATIQAALAAAPGALSSELTAGRDSRLVLQLTARAGVVDQVRFCTYGPTTSPDAKVASEIARQLGLRYETGTWPALPGGPTLENFVAHVRNVSAQIACWETSAPGGQEGIRLSGLTGESLRTNYPRKTGLTSIDAAEEAFSSYRFGRYHYVRTPVLDDLQQRSRRLFLSPLESGAAPEDLFDIFYVQHRLRRWIGDKPDRFGRYVFPLYSPVGVRIVMAGGWEARARAAFHEELAQRAHLPIADVSFEQGTRWRSPNRIRTPTDDSAADETDGRVQASASPSTRRNMDELRVRAIREAVEFDDANPAFDMVDRNAMLADADRYGELDRRQQIELHHALTVVLWLGLARPDREAVRS